jgi:hypothetical protein
VFFQKFFWRLGEKRPENPLLAGKSRFGAQTNVDPRPGLFIFSGPRRQRFGTSRFRWGNE